MGTLAHQISNDTTQLTPRLIMDSTEAQLLVDHAVNRVTALLHRRKDLQAIAGSKAFAIEILLHREPCTE